MKLRLELLYKTVKANRRRRLLSRRPDIRRWTQHYNNSLLLKRKARKTGRVCAVKAARMLPLQPKKRKPCTKARSKSVKAEPEQFQLQIARQKLTSVVTSAANNLSGKFLLRYEVVDKEFGRLIEDIRKLKFDG